MNKFVFLASVLAVLTVYAPKAQATSGPGCLYVVNVANWDKLNMRSGPSARSRVVGRLSPRGHGIIRLNGKCIPLNKKWSSRWCPVTEFNGNSTNSGWVKARFIRDSQCP